MRKRILSASLTGIFAFAVGAVTANVAGAGSGSAALPDGSITAMQTSALSAGSDTTGTTDEPGWQ